MTKTIYRINEPFTSPDRGRYRRRLAAAIVLFVVLIGAGVFIFFDLRDADKHTGTPATGPTFHSTVAGAQVFKNSYFQFSDTVPWVFMPSDSGPNKFTYIYYVAKLPAHMVTVYVNQTPSSQDLATTHVLPVNIADGNSFTVGAISDACGTTYKPTDLKRVKPVSVAGTTMLCVPDSPQYTAVVGQEGADYNLMLTRNNGQTARYVILYHNLTANPDPGPFLRIMRSFQAV